jgi:hypothetical protein
LFHHGSAEPEIFAAEPRLKDVGFDLWLRAGDLHSRS